MDPEAFLEIATAASKLVQWGGIFFEFSHAILTSLYYKDELGTGAHVFSRKHPLACYVSCLIQIFGGSLLAMLLLGEPLVSAIKNTNSLLIASLAWYLIFYSPMDIFYKLCKFYPIKIILSLMKEFLRVEKVHHGVNSAALKYPNSYAIMIIIGTIKGNGTAFLKFIDRFLRGAWSPSSMLPSELMQMTFPTKACVAASVIFVVDKKMDVLSCPHALVYFGIQIFFIYFKLSSMLLGSMDPFLPLENLFAALFLGGIWDTLQRLLTPASKGDQTSVKSDSSKNGKTESAKKKE